MNMQNGLFVVKVVAFNPDDDAQFPPLPTTAAGWAARYGEVVDPVAAKAPNLIDIRTGAGRPDRDGYEDLEGPF